MKTPDFSRYMLSFFATATKLSGCGGSQMTTVASLKDQDEGARSHQTDA
jgi:hypothetical protein